MRFIRSMSLLAAVIAAVLVTACGGGSPSSPSEQGTVLNGTLLPSSAGFGATGLHAMSGVEGEITVTVEGTSISAIVAADGSFTLRGLPSGTITLVFSSGGVTLGTITLDAVNANQEITLVVAQTTEGGITVVSDKRNGIGHGDVEIEGPVQSVVTLSTTGDSTFLINGYTVVARPGQTAIRSGNRSLGVDSVTVGAQVHVKGTWEPMVGSVQPVLAHEIKIQSTTTDGDTPGTRPCLIAGGRAGEKIQLEGSVSSGTATSFVLAVNGNRSLPVNVEASTATFTCNGTKLTGDACKATLVTGSKVHVGGTLTTCTTSAASLSANSVKIQK